MHSVTNTFSSTPLLALGPHSVYYLAEELLVEIAEKGIFTIDLFGDFIDITMFETVAL